VPRPRPWRSQPRAPPHATSQVPRGSRPSTTLRLAPASVPGREQERNKKRHLRDEEGCFVRDMVCCKRVATFRGGWTPCQRCASCPQASLGEKRKTKRKQGVHGNEVTKPEHWRTRKQYSTQVTRLPHRGARGVSLETCFLVKSSDNSRKLHSMSTLRLAATSVPGQETKRNKKRGVWCLR